MHSALPYRIIYSRRARGNLRGLTAGERSLATGAIEEQLAFQPNVATRNRKPLVSDQLGIWELRVRHLRVFYTIEDEDEPTVYILALGIKVRSQVLIDGKEANLREED